MEDAPAPATATAAEEEKEKEEEEGWLWPVWGAEACAADEAAAGRAGVLPPSLRAAAVAWRSPEALFPGRRIALFAAHKPSAAALDSAGDDEADGAGSQGLSATPSRAASRQASRQASRYPSRLPSRDASPSTSPNTSRDVSPLTSGLASPRASRDVSRSASRHLLDGAGRAAGDAGAGAGRGRGRRAAAAAAAEAESVVPPKVPVGRDSLAAAFASAVTALLASSHGRAARRAWTPAWHVIPWDSVLDADTDIQRTTYAVRLFHMGCWRRVVVNDELPVDAGGDVLLPATDDPCVVWPYVLFKAVALLAARTWTRDEEVREFSVMECLSSAVLTEEPLASRSADEVWALVKEHTSCSGRYRDDAEKATAAAAAAARQPSEHKRVGCPGSRKKRPPSEPPFDERTFVFAILQAPGGRRHALYLQKARVLAVPDMGTMERWRRVRWVEWARRHNVPFLEDKPYKVVNVHGAFPRDERCSRGASEPPCSRMSGRKDDACDEPSPSQRDLKFLLDEQSDETDIKYQRRWFIMDDIVQHLKYLHVYRMPQYYASSYVVSDIEKPTPEHSNGDGGRTTAEKKDSDGFYSYSSEAYSEPVYVLVDSDGAKQLVFHLSVVPKAGAPAAAAADDDADSVARGAVLLEDFCWWLPGTQVPFCALRSVGANSGHLRLGAGRYVLRLWFSMHRCRFVLRCLADCRRLCVGARDAVLARMGDNSVRVEALGCVLRDLFQDVHFLFGKHDCAQVVRDFHDALRAVADRPAHAQRLLLDAVAQFVASQRRRSSALTADKLRRALATVFSGAKLQPRKSPSPAAPGTPRSGGTAATATATASLAGTDNTFRTQLSARAALARRPASSRSDRSPAGRRPRSARHDAQTEMSPSRTSSPPPPPPPPPSPSPSASPFLPPPPARNRKGISLPDLADLAGAQRALL